MKWGQVGGERLSTIRAHPMPPLIPRVVHMVIHGYHPVMIDHLELLAAIARADGRIAPEEVSVIWQFLEAAGVDPAVADRINQLLDPTVPLDVDLVLTSLAAQSSPWSLAHAVRDAYIVAAADGEVSTAEALAVERLFDLMNLEPADRAMLHAYAAQAARAQRTLTTRLEQAISRAEQRTATGSHVERSENDTRAIPAMD